MKQFLTLLKIYSANKHFCKQFNHPRTQNEFSFRRERTSIHHPQRTGEEEESEGTRGTQGKVIKSITLGHSTISIASQDQSITH